MKSLPSVDESRRCIICSRDHSVGVGDDLLTCVNCDTSYHQRCHMPVVTPQVCSRCCRKDTKLILFSLGLLATLQKVVCPLVYLLVRPLDVGLWARVEKWKNERLNAFCVCPSSHRGCGGWGLDAPAQPSATEIRKVFFKNDNPLFPHCFPYHDLQVVNASPTWKCQKCSLLMSSQNSPYNQVRRAMHFNNII